MEKLIIQVTVGYMLKVLKSQKKLTKYHKEFASIRHGNYYDFINLIGEPIPFMVTYNSGIIKEETKSEKGDIDFVGLLKAGPSLKKFYYECKTLYGDIIDPDLSDDLFQNLVLFEIAMRMHANNNNLLSEREQLENVINKLSSFKNFTIEETNQLHLGRRFLNMVKHNTNQFKSWEDGIAEFNHAMAVLDCYQLTVI